MVLRPVNASGGTIDPNSQEAPRVLRGVGATLPWVNPFLRRTSYCPFGYQVADVEKVRENLPYKGYGGGGVID